MISGSGREIWLIVLLCVSMRVQSVPSSFFQDEPPQEEQQEESISERFFDEVRQLLEQRFSSETVSAAEVETTTTEQPSIVNAEEHFVDTTVMSKIEHKVKDNLPAVKPPKPTQVID